MSKKTILKDNQQSSVSAFFDALQYHNATTAIFEPFDLPIHLKLTCVGSSNYTNITHNVYGKFTQLSHIWVEKAGSEDSYDICQCTQIQGCNSNCLNRKLFTECVIGNCPATVTGGKFCLNTTIQRRAYPKTEIFITKFCGFGLRLCQNVSKDEIVIEYTGEVITSEDCYNRMKKYKATDDFYFAALGNGMMLDAKKMGSIARFANHSCHPTCELQKWKVGKENRIVLVALRDLSDGTEITYNYQYFEDGCIVKHRQQCRCGASICCGTIGGKIEKEPVEDLFVAMIKKLEAFLTNNKRYSIDVVMMNLKGLEDFQLKHTAELDIHQQNELETYSDRLKQIIEYAKEWVEDYRVEILSKSLLTQSPLIPLIQAKALFERKSPVVRSDTELQLKQLLANVKKANNLLRKISDHWQRSKLNCNYDVSTHEDPLTWSDVLEAFQLVYNALPIACDYQLVDQIFFIFHEISNAIVFEPQPANGSNQSKVLQAMKLLNQSSYDYLPVCIRNVESNLSLNLIVPPNQTTEAISTQLIEGFATTPLYEPLHFITSSNKFQNTKFTAFFSAFSSDAHLELKVNNDWNTIERLCQRYYSAIEPSVKTITLTNNIFYFESKLNHILEQYIDRYEICIGKLNLKQSSKNLFNDKSEDVVLIPTDQNCSSMDKNPLETSNDKKETNATGKVVCFCQLPEGISDFEYKNKMDKVIDKTYLQCDKCKEWYHPHCANLITRSFIIWHNRNRNSEYICPQCVLLNNELSGFAFNSHADWHQQIGHKIKQSAEQTDGYDSVKSDVKHHPMCLSNDLVNDIRIISKLPIVEVPVFQFLQLCNKFVTNWNFRVNNYINSPSFITILKWYTNPVNYQPFFVGNGEKILIFFKSTECLQEEAIAFKNLLRLYYELRLIRVVPSLELHLLRLLIWFLSTAPIYSFVLNNEMNALLSASANGHSSFNILHHPAMITSRQLNSVLSTGENYYRKSSLLLTYPLIYAAIDQTFKIFDLLQSTTKSFLLEAKNCQSLDEAKAIVERMGTLCTVIDLRGEYHYAKIKCMTRRYYQLNATLLDEDQKSKYCWCRGVDDGSPMICCDSCEDWFHVQCVQRFESCDLSKGKEEGNTFDPANQSIDKDVNNTTKGKRKRVTKKLLTSDNYQYNCITCTFLKQVNPTKYKQNVIDNLHDD